MLGAILPDGPDGMLKEPVAFPRSASVFGSIVMPASFRLWLPRDCSRDLEESQVVTLSAESHVAWKYRIRQYGELAVTLLCLGQVLGR